MTTSTVLLLVLSAITAFGLSFYQYLLRAGKRNKTFLFLALLRFITWFAIFVLLINPVITRRSFETVKTPLPVLIDNSQSVKELGREAQARAIAGKILSNNALREKYDVQPYTFGESFESGKASTFRDRQTNIDEAAQNLKQLYRSAAYPVVLLTDGNQTVGNDYVYSFRENSNIYPVALGDTTAVLDLRVNQVNANKYALLKNKFPVEVFLQYSGSKAVNAAFSIYHGSSVVVHKQNVSFSSSKKAQAVTVLLDASKVGVQTYRAVLSSGEAEKNKYNNTKNFAVEVIDQRSEVAIVASINHPDLGALKRAIESNKQRHVTILKPAEVKSLQDYNVLVLYQPDGTFRQLLDSNKNAGINTLTITGVNTDFNLVNQSQDMVQFRMTGQREEYSADFNNQFNLFAQDNIGFEGLPPLLHPFGTITIKQGVSVMLQASIRNVKTDNPMLLFSESGGSRNAVLVGENIWKWRIESHLKNKSFSEFDIFIDKTVQFLASNSKRRQLAVNHESFYNSGQAIVISAQYFNKNYEFEENAHLTIQLRNKATNTVKAYDFLKGSGEYRINFDGLLPGKYSFTVKEESSKTTYSGAFEVLDFEIEKQFVNPDMARLAQVASTTGGAVFYEDQAEKLIESLLDNQTYKAVEKATISRSPLIDWIWLLVLVCVSLAAEWFIRKYNGLL